MAIAVPSARAENGLQERESTGWNVWKHLKSVGTTVTAAASLLVAEAGTISADPPKKLEPPEVKKLAHDLGNDVHSTRADADNELFNRLDYDSMLLLAP